MPTQVTKILNTTTVVHEPGNGTRYEAVGVKLPAGVPEYGGMWLVSFPLIGASYLFSPGNYLSVGYVAEKLQYQRNGLKVGDVDLHEMTKCITIITGGRNNAATDDGGRFPLAQIAR